MDSSQGQQITSDSNKIEQSVIPTTQKASNSWIKLIIVCIIGIVILSVFFGFALRPKKIQKMSSTPVDTIPSMSTQISVNQVQKLSFDHCLPSGFTVSTPFSYKSTLPAKVSMTLGEELQSIGAYCLNNKLVDPSEKSILINRETQCGGTRGSGVNPNAATPTISPTIDINNYRQLNIPCPSFLE